MKILVLSPFMQDKIDEEFTVLPPPLFLTFPSESSVLRSCWLESFQTANPMPCGEGTPRVRIFLGPATLYAEAYSTARCSFFSPARCSPQTNYLPRVPSGVYQAAGPTHGTH